MTWPARIADEAELEELLSRPDEALRADLAAVPGDLLVLGAEGPMGTALCRLAKRADPARRVIAAGRWPDAASRARLEASGIECHETGPLDRAAVAALPDAPNLVLPAPHGIGQAEEAPAAWAANLLLPAIAAERFAASRIGFLSSGAVLAPVSPAGPLPDEGTPPAPAGEFAASCLGRERILQHAGATRGTRLFGLRLGHVVEPRHGLLREVAARVQAGAPVPLGIGHANVIWQGDAAAWTLRALRHADAACPIMQVTGPETVSIRWLAARFGALMGREPVFAGSEAAEAPLANAAWAFAAFGYPRVPLEILIAWVADWVQRGGPGMASEAR